MKDKTDNKFYDKFFHKFKFIILLINIGAIYFCTYAAILNYSQNIFYLEIISKLIIIFILFCLIYFFNIVFYKSFLFNLKFSQYFKNIDYKYIFYLILLSILTLLLFSSFENLINVFTNSNVKLINKFYLYNNINLTYKLVFYLFFFPIIIELLFKGMITKSFIVIYNIKKTLIYSVLILWIFYFFNNISIFSNEEYFKSIKIVYSFYLDMFLLGIVSTIFYINTDRIIYPIFLHVIYNLFLFIYNYYSLNKYISNNITINLFIFVVSIVLIILLFKNKFVVFKNIKTNYLIYNEKYFYLKNITYNNGININ